MRRQQDRPVRIFSAPKRHELELPILYTNRYMISEGHQRSMAGVSEVGGGGLEAGFSSPEKEIVLRLKLPGGGWLSGTSAELGVFQSATLQHFDVVRAKRLLARSIRAG